MSFQNSFILLQQEGWLFRTALAQGLTSLRNANLSEKGMYYAAFFGLSIGLERLFKIIIILEYMTKHELNAPTISELKRYGGKSGHDLKKLFNVVCSIEVTTSTHPLNVLKPPSLENEIIDHLSQFGENCGRYANLNALAYGKNLADPLVHWKNITTKILNQDVPASTKQAIRNRAAVLANAVAGVTYVVGHDIDKTPLSIHQSIEIPQLQALAARQAVLRISRILLAIKHLLKDVNERVLHENHKLFPGKTAVPFMCEFLDFVPLDEQITLRKKRWP
jgi:hypothetical protein